MDAIFILKMIGDIFLEYKFRFYQLNCGFKLVGYIKNVHLLVTVIQFKFYECPCLEKLKNCNTFKSNLI